VSVGVSGRWGQVISLLVSLMPLWLVCWCQQMQVGGVSRCRWGVSADAGGQGKPLGMVPPSRP